MEKNYTYKYLGKSKFPDSDLINDVINATIEKDTLSDRVSELENFIYKNIDETRLYIWMTANKKIVNLLEVDKDHLKNIYFFISDHSNKFSRYRERLSIIRSILKDKHNIDIYNETPKLSEGFISLDDFEDDEVQQFFDN